MDGKVGEDMRVNILGCAPGWHDAPYDKGERWGINDNHKLVDKLDLIFDCHNLKRVLKDKELLGRRNKKEVLLGEICIFYWWGILVLEKALY